MSTTNTWQKLAQPEKTAGEIARETNWVEITEGSEKQIKFANDLRNEWIASVTNQANIANVRYAVVQQVQNGLDLMSVTNCSSNRLEYSYLAKDAVNRRIINVINTNDAKTIIDFFKDAKQQATWNDLRNTYDKVIRRPANFEFNGKRWIQVAK